MIARLLDDDKVWVWAKVGLHTVEEAAYDIFVLEVKMAACHVRLNMPRSRMCGSAGMRRVYLIPRKLNPLQ